MKFEDNVGTVDRALRISAGLGLLICTLLGFIGLWGWIGAIPLLTGVFGYCPLYQLIRFSSVTQ